MENGICASHVFNARKSGNGRDNVFFFHRGKVMLPYVKAFGPASEQMIADLERRSNLTIADWYLNRAIVNVFIAFGWRCKVEFSGVVRSRDDKYWMRSALRRFQVWQRLKSDMSVKQRGLIKSTPAFGSDLMLGIEAVETEDQFDAWAESLWPSYRLSQKAFVDFLSDDNWSRREALLKDVSENDEIHPDVAKCLMQLHLDVAPIEKHAA